MTPGWLTFRVGMAVGRIAVGADARNLRGRTLHRRANPAE